VKGSDGGRAERLLALLLLQSMKSSPTGEKMLNLSIAGFSNIEIADILQIPTTNIAQRLYDARKAKGVKKKGKGSKKSKKSDQS
jgi:DNA-directed RNA polymerase specialized sigma24 family protein